jgi:hypothetical protein
LNANTNGGFLFGNRHLNTVGGTASSTVVGTLIRIADSTSNDNTTRGLEVQSYTGNNTLGVNTAIAAFGKTFGVHAYTDGLAGAKAQPAAVFAEIGHPTSGNAVRAYSGTTTSGTIMSIYHEKSDMTGTALLMNIGNQSGGTGSFASGNFIDLKKTGTTQWIVKHDGTTGIGTSSPWRTLSLSGTAAMPGIVNDSTGFYMCVNQTTGQLATSSGACGASSIRFKENIEDLNYGLDAVMALHPVSFDYKAEYVRNEGRQIGFIAEEVEQIMPELVNYGSDGEVQGLDYPKFTSVLAKAIQELSGKVVTLEGLLNAQTQVSTISSSTMTVGYLLQLQDEGQDRFMVATSGSISVLTQGIDDNDIVLTINRNSAPVFTINARGDVRIKGSIVIESDSFAGSIATDATTGLAEIDFANHLGTGKPSVQLTTEGDVPAIAQVASWKTDGQGNYIGLVLKTFGLEGQTVSANVHYAVFGKPEGYTTKGDALPILTNSQMTTPEQTIETATSTQPTITETATSTESTATEPAQEATSTAPTVIEPITEQATSTQEIIIEPVTETPAIETVPIE